MVKTGKSRVHVKHLKIIIPSSPANYFITAIYFSKETRIDPHTMDQLIDEKIAGKNFATN